MPIGEVKLDGSQTVLFTGRTATASVAHAQRQKAGRLDGKIDCGNHHAIVYSRKPLSK